MHTALIIATEHNNKIRLNQSLYLTMIEDKPLFRYSVDTFLSCGFQVILVVSKKDYNDYQGHVPESVEIVLGGKTRQESVLFGLKHVSTPYIHIHDAARPLITEDTVSVLTNELQYVDAVILAEPVLGSIKVWHQNRLTAINQEGLLFTQTPQAFLTEKLRQAYIKTSDVFYDDIDLYQHVYQDENIKVIINNDINLKVTYPKDITFMKHYFKIDKAEQKES